MSVNVAGLAGFLHGFAGGRVDLDTCLRAAQVIADTYLREDGRAGDPRCRYCGADCSEGRSWDGGDLYACPTCANARSARIRVARDAWQPDDLTALADLADLHFRTDLREF